MKVTIQYEYLTQYEHNFNATIEGLNQSVNAVRKELEAANAN